MNKPALAVFLISLAAVSLHAQKGEYTKRAELDAEGNVYVSSKGGKLIKMADRGHCSEVSVAEDKQTVGCLRSLQLEIYLKGGQKNTIEIDAPIRDWHFWKQGQQVVIQSGQRTAAPTYTLYDSRNVRLVQQLAEPSDERLLPQWAKSRAQIEYESVPTSAALMQERTQWIAKVLRDIGTIKPGMRRKDLAAVFTTEGGLSTRLQRIYVLIGCPYIKVEVRFTAVSSGIDQDAEDLIDSISTPYLEWSVSD